MVHRIAEEVEFVIDNFDFALEPGKALENYIHSRNMLAVLLILDFLYEASLLFYIAANYEFLLS